MKITVIGRPARVVERGDVAIVTLRSEKVPSLPKGLPTPAGPTDYAVLIARKQWLKVAQAAANPADLLISIVEGVLPEGLVGCRPALRRHHRPGHQATTSRRQLAADRRGPSARRSSLRSQAPAVRPARRLAGSV